ncbi:MAG TPA: Gfo/Idh/MocA family oxidoreductase [Acidobacteriaceae bacterium]|jgi:predicted dehydrogenase|nr:Gfo/Idh/MocA family oxidoreductase [Acidobacteriaceae bacterium]
MVRYGILGFGHHGERRLAPAFDQTKNSQLSGIWRRNQERARDNAQHFNIAHVFATPEELCASPAIDAVFVASPDALHSEHTLLALRHGKAVLCEKPLAMSASEAVRMASAARAAGRVFGVAQNFRYNSSLQRMRALVAQGTIGTPVFASAHFCFLSRNSPRTWINDGGMACGGPIGDVGIHAIDALRFLLEQEVLAIATLAQGLQSESPSERELEESAALSLEFSLGVLANIQVTFRAEYRTFIEVVGEQGVLTAESGLTVDRPVTILHHAAGTVLAQEVVSNRDAYSRMLDAFSAAVEGTGIFASTGEDGIQNQRILDAAFRSWHSGCRERIR